MADTAAPTAAPITSWKDAYNRVAAGITSVANAFSPEAILRAEANKPDGNPAKLMFDQLAERNGFTEGTKGRRELDTVRNDEQFMNSLNNAMRNDPTVIPGLIQDSTSGNGAMSAGSMLGGLQSASNRKMMGKVLDAVAAPTDGPGDTLNYGYLKKVAETGQKVNGASPKLEDYKDMQSLLGEAGVKDKKLDRMIEGGGGARGMFNVFAGGFADMMNDPKGFFKEMFDGFGATGAQGAAMGKLAEVFSKVLEFFVSGDGGFRDYYNKHGSKFRQMGEDAVSFGKDLTGETDRQRKELGERALRQSPVTAEENDNELRRAHSRRTGPASPEPQKLTSADGVLQTSVNVRQDFADATAGIVKKGPDMGVEMERKLGNNNFGLSMTG